MNSTFELLISTWWIAFPVILVVYLYLPRSKDAKQRVRPPRRGVDRAATYPCQFPIGWYRICNSEDIPNKGQIRHAIALGREMVIFRSDDEKREVYVLDAFCSHMGANLAFGGRVIPGTNCIQCPFHLWEFEGKEGRCTKIPYIDGKIPDKSQMHSYPCVERHGMVMIWYHPLHEQPTHECICVDELLTDRFEYRGKYSYPNIQMHLQEFAENAADVQHFQPLHGQLYIPWTKIRVPNIFIQHKAALQFGDKSESHIAYFYDTAMIKFRDKCYPSTKADASITFHGPAGITLFRFDGSFGRIYLFHTHTPKDFTELDVQFRAFVETKIPRVLHWYIIGNWIAQWQRDIEVWENKIHKRSPCLVKNDGPILKMRRWFSQFYVSKETLEYLNDTLDW